MKPEPKRAPLGLSEAMRVVLDSVSDGIAVMDTERRLVFLNRRARQLLDVGDADVAGSRCRDILDTTDCEHNCPLTRLEQRGERSVGIEMTYRGLEGRELVAESTFEPLRDDSGAVIGSVEVFRDLGELRRLQQQLYGRRGLGRLVGKSCAMRHVYELVERAAAGVSPVLVCGETGTGKELVARSIHDHSRTAAGAFVPINCAAHGDRSIERELFGTPRRAGAAGRIAAAVGGTLFLDEVDRLPSKAQRTVFERLVCVEGDVRVIASTARDIESAVDRGAFDRDLFFALNSLSIQLAPLRERAEDVPLLVDHFLRVLNQGSRARSVERVAPDAMDILCGYAYPGNVRELEHAIEHAFTRCRGRHIRLDHLPPSLTDLSVGDAAPDDDRDPSDSVEILERDFLSKVCEEHAWKLNSVAEQLGLSRTTLWRKLRRLGIEKPGRRGA